MLYVQVLSEVRRGYLPFVTEPLTPEDQQGMYIYWCMQEMLNVKLKVLNNYSCRDSVDGETHQSKVLSG